MRRFDHVIEMEIPPIGTRRKILQKQVKSLKLSDSWINHVAAEQHIAPALVARAARVISMSHEEAKPPEVEREMGTLINSTLQAMGKPRVNFNVLKPQITYRLDLLNCDQSIKSIIKGLKRHPHARLCFYGPPGTGKSALGEHIAHSLERPLIIKRASDLLSMYIGETEKNIATMFRQAQQDGSILMIDEADSFLQDRGQAHRSWEVTQVNELLTQMEKFEGIFIGSTNLMEQLDSAVLRRFDLKLCFDYLRPDQKITLLQKMVTSKQLKKGALTAEIIQRLQRLENLTPGDFTVIARQQQLRDKPMKVKTILKALERESSMKPGQASKNIGFTANI